MIQQTFQQYALLREEECILKFLHTLSTFANIDQESYRCELIVSLQGGMGWGGMGWDDIPLPGCFGVRRIGCAPPVPGSVQGGHCRMRTTSITSWCLRLHLPCP